MRRYTEYKDSQVPWIGLLPSKWRMIQLKRIAEVNPSRQNDYPPEMKVVFLPMEKVDEKGRYDTSDYRLISEVKNGFTSFSKGDIIIAKITPCFENGKGAYLTELPTPIGYGSTEFHVIRGRENRCCNAFLYYLTKAQCFRQVAEAFMVGSAGQKRVQTSFVERFLMPLPSLPEQNIISDFLQKKIGQIDDLIAKKQRLIELLQEERAALINQAVTKGLNPNVQIKDSGIEWLGEIPEHWNITKVKFHTRQIIDGTHVTPSYVDDGIPFLRVTDIQSEEINLSEVKRIPLDEHQQLTRRTKPERGDLLLSKNGTIGLTKVINWDWEFSIFVSLCLIKLRETLNNYFFSYLFSSEYLNEQIQQRCKTTSVTNLHLEQIKELIIALPPTHEQEEIGCHIQNIIRSQDSLVTKINKEIDLLNEYKTALINEAVTGKIDVRDYEKQNE